MKPSNSTPMKPLRYIAYLRKSSESEERQELSIPAQEREIRQLASRLDLTLVGEPLKESMSAKTPGRPLFSKMLEQIQKSKADGILCWKLDRLARNPLDGGAIMWALGQGTIKEIITPDRTYTGTGDDKLLMSIIFGMATKYSDDLSDNVKRGNREALERGFWPSRPKLGYVRDHQSNKLVPDPERFGVVKQMWKMLLGGRVPLDILYTGNSQLGLRTPQQGSQGGRPLSRRGLYDLFHDRFYTGVMVYNGQVYEGTHEPMITNAEFERAQEMISGRTVMRSKPKTLFFPYRGLIRCGACGHMVTAENTTNRHGQTYTYYHCCRKERRYMYCPERSIEVTHLEQSLREFLRSLVLPPNWMREILKLAARLSGEQMTMVDETRERMRKRLDETERKLERLRELLVDEVITCDDYDADRNRLILEKEKLRDEVENPTGSGTDIEPFKDGISFVEQAISAFDDGTPEERHEIIAALTSNLSLSDRTVLIEAKKPFSLYRERQRFPNLRRGRDSNP